MLQLHLPGPAAEVGETGGRAPTASGPFRIQLEQVQMLQLSAQIFYQLDTESKSRARHREEMQNKNKLRT